MDKKNICVSILFVLHVLMPPISFPGDITTIGMYGLPDVQDGQGVSLTTQLFDNNVSTVFVPPNLKTITFFKDKSLKVFVTLNVFGGKQPWKKFPDSIPVLSDGTKLSGKYGGICPTHFEWRESRLQLLDQWMKKFSADNALSGIWLDFIRYPGSWEHADSIIPDTCYCDRCLLLFQVEKGVDIPKGLNTQNASEWIKNHAYYPWLEWKKEQITSFVRDARVVIDTYGSEKPVELGAFLVPWMQGEKNSSVIFLLGQDAEQISRYVDVLSPMVYHEMVSKQTDWVEGITEYFADIADKPIWPIIQAENLNPDEFADAVEAVTSGGGDGILVYSYPRMENTLWPVLSQFRPQENVNSSGNQSLNPCEAQKKYLFDADFFRESVVQGSYPEIHLWGKPFLLNTHRMAGKYQRLRVRFVCSDEMAISGADPFSMGDFNSEHPFYFRNPQIIMKKTVEQKAYEELPYDFFPVGAYGGNVKNLAEFKESGLNSSLLGFSREAVEQCVELEMHCTFSLPRDVEKIKILLDKVGSVPEVGRFAFYVNDEPGIHSFPRWKAKDINLLLKERYPGIPTMMAIVRPQVIPDYMQAADFFMLDQYPVPFMPMTWLSDSMDIAAETAGRKRLYSIIQAFGGEKWKEYGWPRLPTYEEMNSLAFLSIIHGSRGIYFYKYQAAVTTSESREAFEKVVTNIQKIQTWLVTDIDFEKVPVVMVSTNRFDPAGNPAIHCGEKRNKDRRLLVCVNTIGTYVTAEIPVHADQQAGVQKVKFTPFEVKLFNSE